MISYKLRSKKYLFCWDEIENKGNIRFLKFLKNFGVDGETARFERTDNDRVNIFYEKNNLSLNLNSEKTKVTLKIDDFKTIEYTARMENGRLYIYPRPKVTDLVDKWVRPLNKYHLKLWIHSTNSMYSHTSIGIGLGTISKPNIFTFAVLDNNSVQWFESALKESIEIYEKNKKTIIKSTDRLILWEKKNEIDKLRKISISLSLVKKQENTSIVLMINSKAFLYTDLYPDDIDWLFTTLSVAKNSLEVKNT
jgi:hypothetical protein